MRFSKKSGKLRAMGRKRTCLKLSALQQEHLHQLLNARPDKRARERLQVALWASGGEHTLQDLSKKAQRARATIQLWLQKFRIGGISGLLQRESPPGSTSPIAQPLVQSELAEGLRIGRWRTAREVADWLNESHGINRARKSVYYWLAKSGRHRGKSGLGSRKRGRRTACRLRTRFC